MGEQHLVELVDGQVVEELAAADRVRDRSAQDAAAGLQDGGGGPAPGPDTVAQVFPALAYEKVAAQGLQVAEDDVVRAVDAVLLPALGRPRGAPVGR